MFTHAPTRTRLWIALLATICFTAQFTLSSAPFWHRHEHAHTHHHNDSHDDHSDDQGHQCAICAAVMLDRTDGAPPQSTLIVHMPLVGLAPIYVPSEPAGRAPSVIRSRGPPFA